MDANVDREIPMFIHSLYRTKYIFGVVYFQKPTMAPSPGKMLPTLYIYIKRSKLQNTFIAKEQNVLTQSSNYNELPTNMVV